MKKNNKNKGFAVTALLYGLSIMSLMTVTLMMSIAQNSRKNTTSTVKSIEQELNTYGLTATEYSETSNFRVPQGQGGYYRIEAYGNGKMLAGTIYLKDQETLAIQKDNNDFSIEINSTTLMNTSAGYIIGTGEDTTSTVSKSFLNGQEIPSSESAKVRISKVSLDEPAAAHPWLDLVGCIKSTNATKITAVQYKSDTSNVEARTTNGAELKLERPMQLSEIYVEYNTEQIDPEIQIYKDTACSDPARNIKKDSGISTSNKFIAGTKVTINRYTPIDSNIAEGNYVISLQKKEDGKITYTKDNIFEAPITLPNTKNEVRDGNYIVWGDYTHSFGRPVNTVDTYSGRNNQKWRIEATTESNIYRIIVIDDYKTLQVTKSDDDTTTGETGPQLISASYMWNGDNIETTETYQDNETQKWKLIPAGLGLYYLKVKPNGNYYLYCKKVGVNNRCYVTNNVADASVFRIFNTNI